MPEILIDGKPFNAQDDSHLAEVTKSLVMAVDPEAAKAVDDIGDGRAFIKRVFDNSGQNLGKTAEHTDKALEAINRGFDVIANSVSKLSSALVQENKATNYDGAKGELIKRGYDTMKGGVEVPDDVKQELAKDFGWEAVELASADPIIRAMRAPLSPKDESSAHRIAGRELINRALLMAAYDNKVQRGLAEGAPSIVRTADLDEYMRKIAASSCGQLNLADGQLVLREAGFLTAGNTGYGSEHMPVIPSSELITEIWMATRVAQQFPRFPMSSASVRLPRLNGRGYAYRSVRPSQQSQYYSQITQMSGVGTDYVQFDAVDIARLIMWDTQFEADVLYVLSSELYKIVVNSMAFAKDDMLMNGNTDLATMDNAAADGSRLFANTTETTPYWKTNTGELDVRSAINGLRKRGLVTDSSTVDFSGAVNGSDSGKTFLENFVKMIGKLGKFGEDQSALRCFLGLHAALPLLTCDKFTTFDKMGSMATLLTGQIGSLFDVPFIKTETCYDRLANTGLYAGSSVLSYGTYVMTRPDLWRIGVREDVQVYSEQNRMSGASAILATERLDFKLYQQSSDSTDKYVAVGIQTQVF